MIELASLPRFDTPHGVVYVATRPQIEAYAPWKASFANQRKDWRYYQIVEDTIVQGFDYRYFILEDAKGEVRAVQPFFLLDQDLLQGSGEFARNMIARVRRLIPKALTMRTLMVGCAAGEGHLDYTSDEQARWVADCLHGALRAYARQQKCGLVVLKEFPHNYRQPLLSFANNGYARVPSLPMVRLSIDYASFEEYMTKALSKVTRKGLRRKFRDAEASAPIELTVVQDVTPFVDEIYPLYLAVWGKSPLQFEKLTKDYMCRLGQEMPDKMRYFIWRQNGKAVAFSLCMVNGDTIYDEYLGLDYAVALDLHLYFWTLRDIVTWAMEHGYKWYCSSALNYDPKLHLKCELVPLDLYVAHTSSVPNFFLRKVLPLLEPTRNDKTLQKFPNFAAVWGDK
jgi:predicted N-acyltransferase